MLHLVSDARVIWFFVLFVLGGSPSPPKTPRVNREASLLDLLSHQAYLMTEPPNLYKIKYVYPR